MTNLHRGALLLGLVALVGLVGAVIIVVSGRDVPAELWAVVFAAVTGTAGVTPAGTITTRRTTDA